MLLVDSVNNENLLHKPQPNLSLHSSSAAIVPAGTIKIVKMFCALYDVGQSLEESYQWQVFHSCLPTRVNCFVRERSVGSAYDIVYRAYTFPNLKYV